MNARKQSLLVAGLSTLCAVTWLINCALDVALSISGSLGRDALLTLWWVIVATCSWRQWLAVRRIA